MKGNTLKQFLDDLLTMGGPEKEFTYRDKRYFLETVFDKEKQLDNMYIFECSDETPFIFSCYGKDFEDCVNQLKEAKIFDGKTIIEAEQEITVEFG